MKDCQSCGSEGVSPHTLTDGTEILLCGSCLEVVRSGRAVTVTLKRAYAKRDPESGYVSEWNMSEEEWLALPPAWRHQVKTTVRVTRGLLEREIE